MSELENIQTPAGLSTKYRFISLLGEGANGKTWLAEDRFLGDKVAIKSLKFDQIDDLKSIDLFKREAATLSGLKIEGVPRYYGSYFDEHNDAYYIIQEYVEHPSIQVLLDKDGKFSEREALTIIERIALLLYGLQKVYSPPIIHRDIKPSNILYDKRLRADGNIGIWLIDFGAVANPQRRTGGSTVAGTFGYMAPEQILGDVCIQSDYYSLGATFLHMITGVPPWKLSSDVFQVEFDSVLNEYAPETSDASRRMLEILLARDIEARPKNATELVQLIHLAQNGKIYDRDSKTEKSSMAKPSIFNRLIGWIRPFGVTEDASKWMVTNGIVRQRNVTQQMYDESGKPIDMYEYTFEYEGIPYVGLSSAKDNVFYQNGARCKVYFDPHDPRLNRIE